MWLHGTTIRSATPRLSASSKASSVKRSGTKYAADRSIECVAAPMANRYINCMLSLPPLGELLKTCACMAPALGSSAK